MNSADIMLYTSSSSKQQSAASWEAVEKAIRSMDGHAICETGLFVNDECFMIIGGGGEAFVCSVRHDNKLYILEDASRISNSTKWVMDGQGSDYPDTQCFSLEVILEVAKAFWATQRPSPNHHWEVF